MTREEAKHIVDVAFNIPQAVRRIGEDRTYHEDEIREAKNMAIQSLEQEPCEDAISRQMVIHLIRRCNSALEEPRIFDCHNAGVKFEQYIMELQSVKPQEPKTGYWIFKDEDDKVCRIYTCDKCGEQISIFDNTIKSPQEGHYNYCPNCGQRKIELQESEVRDMTREEAINNLKMISVAFVEAETKEQRKIIDDTFNMAIKALEQLTSYEQTINKLTEAISNQAPKIGHWIEVIDEIDSLGNKTWHHKCSICGNENSGWGGYKYCPNCGARMESEDKE